MKPTVLITDKVDYLLIDLLANAGINVEYKPGIIREDLLKKVKNVDAIVVRSKTRVDKEVIVSGAKGHLKLIARAGIGLDNIDVETAKRYGIEVINAPEASVQSVAELTIGLLLASARKLQESILQVKRGSWIKITGHELYGKKLLIVGYGRIGKRVAEIAKCIGMKIIIHDLPIVLKRIKKEKDLSVEKDLCNALSQADYISLHVPLNSKTFHLINMDNIKCIKKGAILINTSRGKVVDSNALLHALREGILSYVGLDVMENEPPKTEVEKQLIESNQTIITPHIGAQTVEAQKRIAEQIAYKIIDFFKVDYQRGDTKNEEKIISPRTSNG